MDSEAVEIHIGHIAEGKIHRFPRGLLGIGGSNERYIVPTFVAIGPYHHGKPELQKLEEVKLAAANRFIANANVSSGDVSSKILSVVGYARNCYADENTVSNFSDANFAAMMLLDGCFLLQFMMENREKLFEGRALSSEYSILKDMMLLENQVPWLVLHALMEFLPANVEDDVRSFVADVGDMFLRNNKEHEVSLSTSCFSVLFKVDPHKSSYHKDYKPANLLDLLRSSQIFLMPLPLEELSVRLVGSSLLSSSAVELAQIGVNLTASTAEWFGDMSVKGGAVYGELSLSPMFLNDVSSGWLVNMAALEVSGDATAAASSAVMCSYLSVVAMLMDRKEDVHQLRAKQVLYSTMSNAQTLKFFKRISQHLGFGHRYFYILQQINKFKQDRPVRSAVHKFLYKHIKAISIILSIASVLVGIFKALREL